MVCLFIVTPAHSQLKAVQKKIEKLGAQYGRYLKTGNDSKLSEYNNELRAVLDKLQGDDKPGSAYLKAQIHEKKIAISIQKQALAPEETRRISSLGKSIQNARKLLQKLPRNRRVEHCDVLQSSTNSLGISCEDLENRLLALTRSVEKAELHIYDYIVPDKTFAQLERFLTKYNYSGSSGKQTQSSQGKRAITELFDLYTLDGNQSTLNQFSEYLLRFPADHRRLLEQSLQQSSIYQDRRLQASKGEQLLSQPRDMVNSGQYRDFIVEAAPSGMAFTALQRLLGNIEGTDQYDVALKTLQQYKSYFCTTNPLHQSACERFESLENSLVNAQAANYRYDWLPVEGDIHTYHAQQQIKLHFSRNYEYITLLPQKEFDPIHLFKLEGSHTKFIKTATENSQLKSNYRFSPNPRDQEAQLIKEEQKKYFLGASCLDSFNANGFLNTDFFIDEQSGIALFVSKSKYQRRQLVRSTEAFNSIWAVDPIRRLQEHGQISYFNGKRKGNANTDIYYSLKNQAKNTWSCPTHLGAEVNTRYSERSPILRGNKLYFASEGHGSLGGFDIFSASLSRQGEELLVTNLKNEILINTPTDELYFQEVYPNNRANPLYYIVSNRDSREGYYKLYQLHPRKITGKPDPIPIIDDPKRKPQELLESDPPEPPPPPPPTSIDIRITELDLELFCKTMQNPPPNLGRGRLLLEGTVNVPTDDELHVQRLGGATVNLSWPGLRGDNPLEFVTDERGHFSTQVPIRDDKGKTIPYWNVVIHKKNQNRVVNFKATIQELTQLCSNSNYAYIDYIAKETDRNERLGVPYFFEFDKHNVSTQLNKGILGESQQLYQQYAKVFSQDRSNVRFIVVAFADTLGTDADNEWLTNKRAEDVRDQLIEWGIPAAKISTYGFGETTQFSHEIDDLPIQFPSNLTGPGVFNQRQKIIHQLNRRAEVIFCSNEYLRDDECLEYHQLKRRK